MRGNKGRSTVIGKVLSLFIPLIGRAFGFLSDEVHCRDERLRSVQKMLALCEIRPRNLQDDATNSEMHGNLNPTHSRYDSMLTSTTECT
nr:hypothetical protein CFP56_13107 [Quercus suber]